MFLPDCIWVWIFSTTSPSWMMSCFTLMPVISVKALASVLDSYSCVVMVSETTLISMPAKGFAALMNHCISFICSSLLSVEGWNSLSIQRLAAASSADAGDVRAPKEAASAMALAVVQRLIVTLLRLMIPSIWSDDRNDGRLARLCLISVALDRAEDHDGSDQRNDGSEPQARYIDAFADRQRGDRLGADDADPSKVNDRGEHQREEQPVAARCGNAQHADARDLRAPQCQPRHAREQQADCHEEGGGDRSPGHPGDVFHARLPQTRPSAKPRAI